MLTSGSRSIKNLQKYRICLQFRDYRLQLGGPHESKYVIIILSNRMKLSTTVKFVMSLIAAPPNVFSIESVKVVEVGSVRVIVLPVAVLLSV